MEETLAGYEHLPVQFQPPSNGGRGLQNGREALLAILPVKMLPRGLLPKRGEHLQPPRFQYGWPYRNMQLIELGRRLGFLVMSPPAHPGVDERFQLDSVATGERLGEVFRNQLGITSCTPRLTCAYSKGSYTCLALTNNYIRGNIRPPQEDVEKIQQYLGFSQPAMWYLDAELPAWGERRVR